MSEEQNNNSDTMNAGKDNLSKRQKKQQKFLKAYGECGVIKYACKLAGINRSTYYEWAKSDPVFAEQLAEVEKDADDTLEYAAYVQSVLGTEEYVVSAGKQVFDENGKPLTVRKYSPNLLITLLKARLPHKYKDKQQVDLSGNLNIQTTWGGTTLEDEGDE